MFEVYGADFRKLDSVENPSSANYSIYWQEIGGLTLIAANTEENRNLLKNDRYIVVNDPKRRGLVNETAYVICNVVVDEERAEITVNGKTADFLLHTRAMQPVVLENTRARDAVVQLVNGNARGLPITAAARGELVDTEIIRYPLEGGAVDEAAMELMKYCGIGKTVWFGADGFGYIVSTGRDLTGKKHIPVFGPGSGRARNPILAIDTSDYCNVATASLTYNDGHSESAAVGQTEAAGLNRRELYCGDLLQEKDESDEAFAARAREEMAGMLSEHIRRLSITAEIDAEDLAELFQLGDIVPVKIGGILAQKRITGIVWLKDKLNDKVSIKLGEPVMNVIAEIKEKKPVNGAVSGQIGGLKKTAKETENKLKLIQEDYKSLIAKVDGVVAGMDAYVLNKVFEDYKYAAARLFATMEEANAALALKVESNQETMDRRVTTVETAQTELVARVDGAESLLEQKAEKKTVKDMGGRIETIESAQNTLAARVDGAEASLEQKAESKTVESLNGRVSTVETAQNSLAARVADAEAALEQKAEKKTVSDLSGRVDTVETAQNSLAARVSSAESSLSQKAEKSTVSDLGGRVDTVEEAQTSLTSRVGTAEASLEQKAEKKTVEALDGRVEMVETAQAGLSARVDGAEASIDLNAQNINGVASSVADIEADVINLKGRVDVTGVISVENGVITSTGQIISQKNIRANTGLSSTKLELDTEDFTMAGKSYTPKEITSTTGTVRVLGIA